MVTPYASVLPGIARDSAEIARRRLGEAVQPTAAEIEGLLEVHHLLTDLLRRSWESAQDAMTSCVEAAGLRVLLEQIRDGANTLLDVVASLRRLTGKAEAQQKDLQADEATLRILREGATRLLDWLAAPRAPLDESRLVQGIAQGERGEVVNADDALAQLKAGEVS